MMNVARKSARIDISSIRREQIVEAAVAIIAWILFYLVH